MTKFLFIQNVLFDHHGIEYLSAALKRAGHTVLLFAIDAESENVNEFLIKYKPDVVAFSVQSSDYKWALPIAKYAKTLGIISFFGGPHPTYFNKFIEDPNVDIMCIGEGEGAIVDLANALSNKTDYTKIANLHVKLNGEIFRNPVRNLVEDLDELADPDKSIYFKYKFLKETPVKRISTSRGCPYNCTYCYNQKYRQLYSGKGKYVRYRSKERIVNEIKEIQNHAVLKSITFTSDTFASNKEWLFEFLEYYAKNVKLPFNCQIRANEIDEEVVKLLKKANCENIYFGVEAGNEHIRNKVYKKFVTNKQIINAGELLHKYDINFLTYNIFGAPNETLKEVWETVFINHKIRPTSASVNILQPLRGTEIHQMIVDDNLFMEGYEDSAQSHFVGSPIKLKEKQKIENLQKLAYFAIMYPSTVPVIKVLIALPLSYIYDLVFKLSLFLKYKKSRGYSLIETIKVAWTFRKYSTS